MAPVETTLVVPPRYAHWMRLAGLRLLNGDSANVASEAEKADKAISEEEFYARYSIKERKPTEWHFSDLEGCASFVADLVPVVNHLGEPSDSISGPPRILCALVDSMVRNVLAKELAGFDFPDGKEGELHDAIRALGWAAKEGDRLATLEIQEREAERAALAAAPA